MLGDMDQTIIKNSGALLSDLKDLALTSEMVLFTADAENLYPSVDQDHLLKRLRELFAGKFMFAKARFCSRLLEIVLQSCFLEGGQTLWHVKRGIPTGVSCCVFLANMYLVAFDLDILKKLPLAYFGRYIDDALGVLVGAKSRGEVQEILNSWGHNIRWEITGWLPLQ